MERSSVPVDCDWLSGACMAIRSDAWLAAGGFDERFFMYYEDEALCRRLRERGWRVAWEPRARAYHQGAASSASSSLQDCRLHASMLSFHGDRRGVGLLRVCVLLRALVRVAPCRDGALRRSWLDLARDCRRPRSTPCRPDQEVTA